MTYPKPVTEITRTRSKVCSYSIHYVIIYAGSWWPATESDFSKPKQRSNFLKAYWQLTEWMENMENQAHKMSTSYERPSCMSHDKVLGQVLKLRCCYWPHYHYCCLYPARAGHIPTVPGLSATGTAVKTFPTIPPSLQDSKSYHFKSQLHASLHSYCEKANMSHQLHTKEGPFPKVTESGDWTISH